LKILRAVVLGIFAVLALGVIVGMMLPTRYEATASIKLLGKPPEDVWVSIVDVEKHPLTGAQRRSFTRLPDDQGLPAWVETIDGGKINARVTEAHPPERLVIEMRDSMLPVSATNDVTIEQLDDGTRVRSHWTTRIESGSWQVPMFRVAMTLSNGARASARDYLSRVSTNLGVEPRFDKGVPR